MSVSRTVSSKRQHFFLLVHLSHTCFLLMERLSLALNNVCDVNHTYRPFSGDKLTKQCACGMCSLVFFLLVFFFFLGFVVCFWTLLSPDVD